MSKLIILLLLTDIYSSCSFVNYHMSCSIIIKKTILYNNKMPILYTFKNYMNEDELSKYKLFTLEHIFPQSLLNNKESNDMHNIIKTINTLNSNRSNYKYCEDLNINDKNWNSLPYGNYVNHKDKTFIPNKDSRGFISRAILYMCYNYNCNYKKVIDKDLLIKWFHNYPPSISEKYHNEIVKQMQNKNNMFISNYNKKNNGIKKFISSL